MPGYAPYRSEFNDETSGLTLVAGRVARIDRLWSYTYKGAAQRFFESWARRLRWRQTPRRSG
jgi:hypothetical protein